MGMPMTRDESASARRSLGSNPDEEAKMMAGGGTMPKALAKHAAMKASKAHAGLKAGGMAKGGGIESKGKTKGTMIKMKSGGRTY